MWFRSVLASLLLCFFVVAFSSWFSVSQRGNVQMTEMLIDTALTMVVTVLGPVVTALLLQWIRVLLAKHKVTLSESMERTISEAIRAGISFAEEQARKSILSGGRMSGSEKLSVASQYALSDLKRRGVDFGDTEQLSRRIESELQSVRPSLERGGQ